jgi:plastocyanin
MKNALILLLVYFILALSIARTPAATTGTIEGIIRYVPDPNRPWRFSRYYVQKSGLLAETVVALEGPDLNRLAPANTTKKCAMDQVNFQFIPETIVIRAGDTVAISNSDDALHNVMTSDGGQPFNVNVVKGKQFEHTFERPGGLNEPIRLGCIFHGGMRAWIYVFDHPWFQLTQKDGRFRLENVPVGKYNLGVVHPAGKLRSGRPLEVKPNATTSLKISLSPDDLVVAKMKDN